MRSKTISTPIKQALKQAAETLKQAGSQSPWLDAELLLAHCLNKDRSFIITHPEQTLSTAQTKKFALLIQQRRQHTPIAYLLGHKEFYGLDFIISPNVLVPRPESERIVDIVKDIAQPQDVLIDIGTGSGCLAISLSPFFASTLALDISTQALAIARKNAKRHNRNTIRFITSDLLSRLPKLPPYSHLMITANLPYLTAAEIRAEKSISREPRLALYGGTDGLTLYRTVARQIAALQKIHHYSITLLCEINPGQKMRFKKIWPQRTVEFKKDLAGKTRIGIVRF